MEIQKSNISYRELVVKISEVYKNGQKSAAIAVNTTLVDTYWHIAQYIVEFEQNGEERAAYGKAVIDTLSKDLSVNLGKGFSRSNLIYMRLFYLNFSISEKASHLLSWSHYKTSKPISNPLQHL